jgi:hypothetical protein
MNEENKSDDLPFLDDLPYTPTPESEQPAASPSQKPEQAAATPSQKPEQAAPAPSPTPDQAAATPSLEPEQAAARPSPAPESEWQPTATVQVGKRAVIPPAILAQRMQRYSIYLIVTAFLILGVNYDALNLSSVLWFAAGLSAGFAILCAVAVVLLNAIAWNFDRLREELRGGRQVVDLRE